jgi:hypothetical protein
MTPDSRYALETQVSEATRLSTSQESSQHFQTAFTLLVLKPIHKTIHFNSGSEHETRQRKIKGRGEREGRIHAQAYLDDDR